MKDRGQLLLSPKQTTRQKFEDFKFQASRPQESYCLSQSYILVAIYFSPSLFRKFSLYPGLLHIFSFRAASMVVCWVFIELNYKAKENIRASPLSGNSVVLFISFQALFSLPNFYLFFPLAFMFHTIKGSKCAFKRCNCRWKLLGGKRHMRKGWYGLFWKCESHTGTVMPPNKPWKYTFGGENMIFKNVIIVFTKYKENIIENLLFLLLLTINIRKLKIRPCRRK